ncbi:molybdenum cofactor biosynthesis protein MoaE [Marinicella sp. W31]|uniref:molybdenum cofactor biosynthesis protein MoaE n=1 Tax=Marinicella sp. W31 TaxID=3023713 RepID=UPI0037565E72
MFQLSDKPIEAENLKAQTQDPSCGGFVCFEGWVRDHNIGKSVLRLDYQAHGVLAQKQGEKILREALSQYDIKNAVCVHRIGTLAIGDMAVWVGVSAAHRNAAFQACRHILDTVKAEVPIWKKEYWADGDSGWVEPSA